MSNVDINTQIRKEAYAATDTTLSGGSDPWAQYPVEWRPQTVAIYPDMGETWAKRQDGSRVRVVAWRLRRALIDPDTDSMGVYETFTPMIMDRAEGLIELDLSDVKSFEPTARWKWNA